ncbi:DUF6541 family protein [Methanothermococcus okinawensis]|uniref:Glycosyltransferase RgtA/B/C/D-like domain-containing protein n=1 Tax=Methanothermococcus okinawensis (strain DSM 14208 / JCM 11175 / IH1) TaxID=647113 RepID=F8AM53_METOI|nr:DUF6541 family protein [Methanothermococcus okinawensis]AEH06738.1 hypothetical protein Metok_0761 [Methanothermococcus okinawensis IH1]
MDIIYFIILLILIYMINPLKNEEKLITTPFLTVSYIVITSYILSVLNIPMYKILYFLPLIILILYRINFKLNNLKSIIQIHYSKSYSILFLIVAISLFVGYIIFPSNPATTTDIQFHSYKTKAMMEDKTIFYKIDEIPYKYYVNYPAGLHSVLYFLSSKISDILNAVQFMKFYIILLFVLGFYLIGNEIKKGMGYFVAIFVPTMNIYYSFISVILPNYLGYSMMLIVMYFAIRYLKTKEKIYLLLMAFVVSSLTLTHTFPILILSLYLLSLTITHNLKTKNLWISFISGGLFSILLIFNKMSKSIVNYASSKNFSPEPISTISHNILAAFGIMFLYISHKHAVDNENTFLISLIFTFLLICGTYFLSKLKYGKQFILLVIFLVLNIINIKFIHLQIPFFSNQYDSLRMAINIQIIMPIFYGAGLYGIYTVIERSKKTNISIYNIIKPLFITFILLFSTISIYTNYGIISEKQKNTFVIHQNDLKVFEYMNNHNITNQKILNFCEDAGQYLPIYTNNTPFFTYYSFQLNSGSIDNVSFDKFIQSVDDKNYTLFLKICKDENISYIYMSDYLGKYDGGFFNNSKYFKIVYSVGNAKLVKVKNNYTTENITT